MIDPKLERRFPSVADIETAAVRIMPNFIGEYISYGMGRGDCVRRNRAALSAVQLMPRYASTGGPITTHCEFLARHYDVPFGVAPVGLGGLACSAGPVRLAFGRPGPALHNCICFGPAVCFGPALRGLRGFGAFAE